MTPVKWFALIAFLAVVYGAWEGHTRSKDQRLVDSTLAANEVLKSQNETLKSQGDSLQRGVDTLVPHLATLHQQNATLRNTLSRRPPVSPPDTTVLDSLRFWHDSATIAQGTALLALQTVDSLGVEVDGLTKIFEAQKGVTAQFRAYGEAEHQRAEGLEHTLRGLHLGCRRIFGLPFPKFGPGAALTTHGLVPAIAIIVPLGSGC